MKQQKFLRRKFGSKKNIENEDKNLIPLEVFFPFLNSDAATQTFQIRRRYLGNQLIDGHLYKLEIYSRDVVWKTFTL